MSDLTTLNVEERAVESAFASLNAERMKWQNSLPELAIEPSWHLHDDGEVSIVEDVFTQLQLREAAFLIETGKATGTLPEVAARLQGAVYSDAWCTTVNLLRDKSRFDDSEYGDPRDLVENVITGLLRSRVVTKDYLIDLINSIHVSDQTPEMLREALDEAQHQAMVTGVYPTRPKAAWPSDEALLKHLPPVQMKDGWKTDANGDIITDDVIVSPVRLAEAQYAIAQGVAPSWMSVDRLALKIAASFQNVPYTLTEEQSIIRWFESMTPGMGAVCRCLLEVRRAAA